MEVVMARKPEREGNGSSTATWPFHPIASESKPPMESKEKVDWLFRSVIGALLAMLTWNYQATAKRMDIILDELPVIKARQEFILKTVEQQARDIRLIFEAQDQDYKERAKERARGKR